MSNFEKDNTTYQVVQTYRVIQQSNYDMNCERLIYVFTLNVNYNFYYKLYRTSLKINESLVVCVKNVENQYLWLCTRKFYFKCFLYSAYKSYQSGRKEYTVI